MVPSPNVECFRVVHPCRAEWYRRRSVCSIVILPVSVFLVEKTVCFGIGKPHHSLVFTNPRASQVMNALNMRSKRFRLHETAQCGTAWEDGCIDR